MGAHPARNDEIEDQRVDFGPPGIVVFLCHMLRISGAVDGARTRDLRRDRPAL